MDTSPGREVEMKKTRQKSKAVLPQAGKPREKVETFYLEVELSSDYECAQCSEEDFKEADILPLAQQAKAGLKSRGSTKTRRPHSSERCKKILSKE